MTLIHAIIKWKAESDDSPASYESCLTGLGTASDAVDDDTLTKLIALVNMKTIRRAK